MLLPHKRPPKLPPEVRKELRETFRPVEISGNPRKLRDLYWRQFEPPAPFSNTEVALLVATAVGVGATVGWFWRKHRESKKTKTKSADLVGLDVVCSL